MELLPFGEILLGFPDGSVRRIRFQSDGNRASAPLIANWQPHRYAVSYIAGTPNGPLIISVVPESDVSEYAISEPSTLSGSNFVHSWDIRPISPVVAFDAESNNREVFGVIQQNGSVRLFATDPRRVGVLGSRTPITETILSFTDPGLKPHAIAFSPAEPLVAVAGYASQIYVYRYSESFAVSPSSSETLNYLEHLENPAVGVYGEAKLIKWSPSGNRIAIADQSDIFVLSRQQHEPVFAFTSYAKPARKLRWLNESRLLSLDADNTVTMWDLERAAAVSPAISQLMSLPLEDSDGPWELAAGSQRTQAATRLAATLRKLLETTIRPLALCSTSNTSRRSSTSSSR